MWHCYFCEAPLLYFSIPNIVSSSFLPPAAASAAASEGQLSNSIPVNQFSLVTRRRRRVRVDPGSHTVAGGARAYELTVHALAQGGVRPRAPAGAFAPRCCSITSWAHGHDASGSSSCCRRMLLGRRPPVGTS
jgi:hypothetical protein